METQSLSGYLQRLASGPGIRRGRGLQKYLSPIGSPDDISIIGTKITTVMPNRDAASQETHSPIPGALLPLVVACGSFPVAAGVRTEEYGLDRDHRIASFSLSRHPSRNKKATFLRQT